jgi:hypothetical protein
VNVRLLDVDTGHDNSSTINSDPVYRSQNSRTYDNNQRYFDQKVANKDFSPGGWVLERRRQNAWDAPR